ncbi:MAG: hypothetical protein CMC14_00665 [Flavobacteriaceae bacterium]|nr:hypothetical protein [Flavobacteriaceae bacterium]|tara:strand:+ start:1771 stop:2178 length:408 start_codon:yes stop_codon:yes gene_type:complete
MNETILKDYFENKISAELLSANLNGSIKKLTYDTSEISVERMKSDSEFEVEQKHVKKILNDALNGNLTFDNLKTIASGLMFSDYFTWESDTEIGNRIATIIVELDNTEINFAISTKNLKLWKEYLESGIHKLKRK